MNAFPMKINYLVKHKNLKAFNWYRFGLAFAIVESLQLEDRVYSK